ncbi:alkaline phosphatase [Coralloluteibacterium stylophorae]|uniref:Alkaline phosphatase n=1 Tax=Coralloluteibacterium stylophorae TaxID=1776034 RepID=A0A8J7VVZ2_9GAMM|nr:alkaline phosphatase [Coralloluteibacterium stylophorae]MBS7456241.1 alkaline phosphatase [Coralloluteibacterium stylophorae]
MRLTFLAAAAAALAAGCATTAHAPSAPAARATPIEVPAVRHPDGETPAWWYRSGAATAHDGGASAGASKVILFVGDGMSLTTVAAARILEGQLRGAPGEENRLSFERFPYTALSKTYNTDQQTPDSAGTMSAMMSGVKTRAGLIGVDQTTTRGACAAQDAWRLSTLELAEIAGLGTGVVSTARITHATPAATYAHVSERGWEYDQAIPATARAAGCADIAAQLVDFPFGDGIDVVLGGGRRGFLPETEADPEFPGTSGRRGDGRDLVAEWRRRHPDGAWAWNRAQFEAIDFARTPKVLGLFQPAHMRYEHDRAQDPGGEPSLTEMTRAAIIALEAQHPQGWFLMVEGGRIDHANHAGNAYRALTETISLADAVAAARAMTSEDDTLILVTADHGHVLSFVGYPARGNPILGKVAGPAGEDGGDPALARDALGRPYTTLNYLNGPGYGGANEAAPAGAKRFVEDVEPTTWQAGDRADLSAIDTEAPDYMQSALFPLPSETHSGDDVGLYASGPGAQAVHGVVEQNAIHHFIVQSQPELRRTLCDLGACNADGVPVEPVAYRAALERERAD